jgi:general secretion pathway protein G
MIYLRDLRPKKTERGGAVTAAKLPGRRVALSPLVHLFVARADVGNKACNKVSKQRGFSLIELVITITVLTILTLSVVPLMKLSVKRQKEQRLHEALRQMRLAIDDFHRDTVDMQCTGTVGAPPGGAPGGQTGGYVDPRSKVKISDCTIFGVDNPDRYPPDLETLVNGVNVIARGGLGGRGDIGVDATKVGELATKKKIYLRSIPIDPMTGEANWDLRSCYDAADSESWGGENLFDVRSKSKETALNGEKYNEW